MRQRGRSKPKAGLQRRPQFQRSRLRRRSDGQRHVSCTTHRIQQGFEKGKTAENGHYIRIFASGFIPKIPSSGIQIKLSQSWYIIVKMTHMSNVYNYNKPKGEQTKALLSLLLFFSLTAYVFWTITNYRIIKLPNEFFTNCRKASDWLRIIRSFISAES